MPSSSHYKCCFFFFFLKRGAKVYLNGARICFELKRREVHGGLIHLRGLIFSGLSAKEVGVSHLDVEMLSVFASSCRWIHRNGPAATSSHSSSASPIARLAEPNAAPRCTARTD